MLPDVEGIQLHNSTLRAASVTRHFGCVILSDEVAAATEETKDPYLGRDPGCHTHILMDRGSSTALVASADSLRSE